ncbi:MAG: hypothetical protein H6602_12570 [Flavobacteriales bacterium]|nr:hypothetical protein [Flavobacteriales bacterium]
MKFSYSTVAYVFAVFLVACSTTQTLVKKETGSTNIEFKPTEVSKEIRSGLKLTVKPIDASALDIHTYFYSRLDGRFFFGYDETSIIRYYNNLESANDDHDEKLKVRRKQSFGLLDDKVKSGLIPATAAELIKYKIKDRDGVGENGIPDRSSTRWSVGQNKNPYFQNGDYMSVVQITVENQSGKNEILELEKLLIQNGNEQLYPFNTDRLLEYEYSDDQKKNLHRINMPDKLTIPNDEKVIKFISTPPINPRQPLSVQYIVGDDVVKFDFEMEVKVSKEDVAFKKFEFSAKKGEFDVSRFYSVVVTKSDTTVLKSNVFYYPTNHLSDKFSIYSILGVEGGFQYGALRNVSFSDFEKGKVEIDYDKVIQYEK